MVQTYGVAKDPDGSHERVHDESYGGEDSALLGDRASQRPIPQKREGVASLVSSTGNLANTIIGSGTFMSSAEIGHSAELLIVGARNAHVPPGE